MFGVILTKYTI